METTKLSSKGQVIIPKHIRDLHHWNTGLELEVIKTEDGILLKPKAPFRKTTLEEVAGCLKYHNKAKSLEEIELAMKKAAKEAWRGSS
jgi:AbrB family looped-hinge helix DNA binding protein